MLQPLKLGDVPAAQRSAAWADAAAKLRDAMEAHVGPLVAAAREVSAESGVPFSGLDSRWRKNSCTRERARAKSGASAGGTEAGVG